MPATNPKADCPILVTGAAGRVGSVGRKIVELLRQRQLPVRAMVHGEDARADALRASGAEVVVGDLTDPSDVARALAGCRRMYFGMSLSGLYLQATVIAGAVAREQGDLEVFVNISQMTVSQMTLTTMTASPQHQQHLLAELALNWSGLPVVHVRPTVFLENPFFLDWAAESSARNSTIALPSPMGNLPVDSRRCGRWSRPFSKSGPPPSKIYELTGPRSEDMNAVAAEYSKALGRTITYVDVPLERWRDDELRKFNLPEHVYNHLLTMAKLHADNRYDRATSDVEKITGRPATSVFDFVTQNSRRFSPAPPIV